MCLGGFVPTLACDLFLCYPSTSDVQCRLLSRFCFFSLPFALPLSSVPLFQMSSVVYVVLLSFIPFNRCHDCASGSLLVYVRHSSSLSVSEILPLSPSPRVSCPPRRFSHPPQTLSAQSSPSTSYSPPSQTESCFSAVPRIPARLYPLCLLSVLRVAFNAPLPPGPPYLLSSQVCLLFRFSQSTPHLRQAAFSTRRPH